jgi:hypothetical protein
VGTDRYSIGVFFLTASRWRAMIVNPLEEYPMARNKNAGKSTAKSKSGKWYAEKATPAQKAKKHKTSTKVNQRPDQVAKRVALAKARRKAKPGKNQDMSHTTDGRIVKENFRKNRARNRGRKPA